MGTAIAKHLERHGHPIRLFDSDKKVVDAINKTHRNTNYLPDLELGPDITATANLTAAIKNAEVVFMVLPSRAVPSVIKMLCPLLPEKTILVNITKGLDPKTLEPPILCAEPHLQKRTCVVGGPAIAQDIMAGCPTGLIVAGKDPKALKTVKHLLESESVKIAVSNDAKGVGLAAALKNPYAIALGICDGLKYPTNAKALILTVAMNEMRKILEALGAHGETALGLAGLGDLVVTSFSPHSRNRSFGERLATSKTKNPAELGLSTVEGIEAASIAIRLIKRHHICAPLLLAVDQCLNAKEDYSAPFRLFMKNLSLN